MLSTVLHDVRYSVRSIRKKPVFYSVVMLVFALGIGANTLVFSVVDRVLLSPLPYPDPEQLVAPWQTHPNWLESDNPALQAQWNRLGLAYPVYEDWLESSPVFSDLGIFAGRTFIPTGGDRPQRISGARVTAGVFGALGIDPVLGRAFDASEDRVGGPRVAVLSHGLWMERFGGDRGALGSSILLDDVPFTIVGVMPRGFAFPEDARIWTTFPDSDRERSRNNQFAEAVARMHPGVTLESAQREMEGLQSYLNEVHPIPGRNYGINVVSLMEETVGGVRSALTLLLAAVATFLLIACANITGLLLLRATERRRELAVRQSLGAAKGRLVRQLLAEGCVLSAFGGGLGLLMAFAALPPFLRLLPAGTPRLDSVTLDSSVLAFSVTLTAVTGVLVSALPGMLASGTELTAVLKDSVRGGAGGRRRHRLQFGLLVSQIALTFVLLAGAGLLLRSFDRLMSVDPGFSSEGVVVMRADLRGARYASAEQIQQGFDDLLARLKTIPGVDDVALARPGPFRGWWSNGTAVDTRAGIMETNTQQEAVSANYFELMGIPLLAGRVFTPDEMERRASVVIVNEATERAFWPQAGAVGQRVRLGGLESGGPWLTVVGVVGDVHRRLDGEPYTTLFHPLDYNGPAVLMKVAGDASGAMAGAREALKAVDPEVPIATLDLLDTEMSRTVAGPRLRLMLLGTFSVFAVLLAVLGIFGLLAHAVAQRSSEIGIRLALGATRCRVVSEVVWRGLAILAVGLPLGILGSAATAQTMEPFLFQVEQFDWLTLTAVATLLFCCTIAASVIPARRAVAVDPVHSLRGD